MKRKNILLAMISAAALSYGNLASASPIDLVTEGDNWDYKVLEMDLWNNWASVGYDSSYFTNLTSNGNAAFGNVFAPNTYWSADTDIALQKNITLNGSLNGNLTLNVAADNGFIIFINGQQVAKDNAEGFTSYWEYTYNISSSYLSPGSNVISVLAEDHGGLTWFDMKLSGDITSNNVPEPSTLLLMGFGVAGFAITKKSKHTIK